MLRRLLALFVVPCACGGGVKATMPAKETTTTTTRQPPVIVVAMVIDQLAGWIAEERVPQLSPRGGFARLRREGTWALDVRYAHAVTDTAPGHAALHTALPPRETGIFANDVIDPEDRRYVSILRDPSLSLVTPLGIVPGFGVSLAALEPTVETIADRFRAERPNAYIVSLSLKDRGALFGCGRRPDACIFYEARAGGFVTSTAFSHTLPGWIPKKEALLRAAARPWELGDESFVRAHAQTPDDQPGEGDGNGLGATFPKKAAASTSSALQSLRYTPEADRILLSAALASLDDRGERPMLLSISLSTFDYVGHVWGPDSWESWDELFKLDAELGRFFEALDARVGPDGWAIVLSGDHGTTSMPEVGDSIHPWCKPGAAPDRRARPCGQGVRVVQSELADELRAVAERAIGKGDFILGVADPYVYFTRTASTLPDDRRAALEGAVTKALLAHPEVAKVVPARRMERCPDEETIDAAICQSLTRATPHALYVALEPGSFFDSGHALHKGTSHGSAYAFDRSVPLFVRGPGVRAGVVLKEPIGFESYARAACALLGVTPMVPARRGHDFVPPAL